MKKINVIDLDKTLIPFDSFRRYIFKYIRFNNVFFVMVILLLRKLRFIKMDSFKKEMIALYRKRKNYQV